MQYEDILAAIDRPDIDVKSPRWHKKARLSKLLP
jgi:hypothetical protein